jgi:hypothetical protein
MNSFIDEALSHLRDFEDSEALASLKELVKKPFGFAIQVTY